MKRIIATLLTIATVIGCLMVLPIGASADISNTDVVTTIPISDFTSVVTSAMNQNYQTAQDKLDHDSNMVKYVVSSQYELYASAATGEVYVKDKLTGQILTTNPYNYSGVNATYTRQALSQIIIKYAAATDTTVSYEPINSFTDAAARGQISITPITGGIRVNYVIGDTTKRYILPASIKATSLLDQLYIPMMKQLEERLQNFAQENHYPTMSDFDFIDFSEKFISRFGVSTLFGAEYNGYGNIYAFDAWTTEVDKLYAAYYNKLSKEQKKEVSQPKYLSAIFSDFTSLNQIFILTSAYNLGSYGKFGFDLDPSTWELLPDRLESYPFLKAETEDINGITYYKNSFFALDTTLTSKQMAYYESIFLNYASSFTLDDVFASEDEVGVTMNEADNPVFKIAIEYTLDSTGVTISVPVSSFVYDETKYVITYISVLPFLGSTKVSDGGYIFYPDGSGAVIDFKDFISDKSTVSGNVYGQDYSFYSISGKHQESISMPIYGQVRNEFKYYMVDPYDSTKKIPVNKEVYDAKEYEITFGISDALKAYAIYPYGYTEEKTYYISENGNQVALLTANTDKSNDNYATKITMTVTGEENFGIERASYNGFLSILTEGASLATINVSVNPYSNLNDPYSSVFPRYSPIAVDSYDLADTISSITTSTKFSVLASGKYLGDYTMKVILLSDDDIAAENGVTEYYSASYVGMAKAYQDYLVAEGVLTAIGNLKDSLPLFVESFGVIQTKEKVLSIPVTVDKPLTTFEDLQTMYNELKDENITNIQFKLSGFVNGGMNSDTPTYVKWEKKVGGKRGLKEMLSLIQSENTGVNIYPSFDFLYLGHTRPFDFISMKKVGARTVDNRYAFKRNYSSVHQEYVKGGGLVLNTEAIDSIFSRFTKKYSKFNMNTLALQGVATDLSGDFSDKNYTTREESLENIRNFLKSVRESGYTSLMSNGGNVYAVEFLDYLLDAPIDSSHYNSTSYPVPLWGMVMHGFIEYAGSPFNEEANRTEALLRAIESGASLYFVLSYQNTALLKDDAGLSNYYAVNYQISKDTVVNYYNLLNETIGDLQGFKITNHQGLSVERVLLDSEIQAETAILETEFLEELAKESLKVVEAKKVLIKDVIALKSNTSVDFTIPYSSNTLVGRRAVNTFVNAYENDNLVKALLEGKTTAAEKGQAVMDAVNAGVLPSEYGLSIGVSYDQAGLENAAKALLVVDELSAEFVQAIADYIAANQNTTANVVAEVNTLTYDSEYSFFTNSDCLDANYKVTEHTISDHTAVMVTYSNGIKNVRIILNYNIFSVNVIVDGEVKKLDRYSYIRLDD